ncbi:MAG: hypothetical protein FJZ38_19175 [Candidatus Rokubacteria bacterium]|nr:hypothetical protein [Candidatus Rokubacteria bacterium]
MAAVIVFHLAVDTVDDYVTKREAHRREHIARLQGLRATSILIGGGPSPDGTRADLFYRLQQPWQVKPAMEEDPYWTGGVWTKYTPRSFSHFVEPWELVPVVLDGSRVVTIVEGPVADLDMAQIALVEMRGAGKLAFGGIVDNAETLTVMKTTDADEAKSWLGEHGFWDPATLTTRPFVWVL